MKAPAAVADFIERRRMALGAERAERVAASCRRLFEDASTLAEDGTVFVATGDIPAMWLRDSTWQVRPLLAMEPDAEVLAYLGAVSRRQARYVCIDPHANAFNLLPDGSCWHRDFPDQDAWVFERKFEIDSLAAFLDLALRISREAGYREHLDADFWRAAQLAVDVCLRELDHDPGSYRFLRPGAPDRDVLGWDGYGAPFAPNGMVWSGFRPSDDRCELPFLVPANAHLAVVLQWLAKDGECPESLANSASQLAAGICAAVHASRTPTGVLPFEVDGLDGALMMDDPNVPGLLALPYLGWCDRDDADYLVTRDWVLSDANPYFVRANGFEGLSSEHTPRGWIWPLSIAVRGLTSADVREVEDCLQALERASEDGLHESFNPQDPQQFTRVWFSWADMTYVQLAIERATR